MCVFCLFLRTETTTNATTTTTTTTITFALCLTDLFFWRSFQVSPGLHRSPKEKPLGIAGAMFYRPYQQCQTIEGIPHGTKQNKKQNKK